MKITDYAPRAAPFDTYLTRGHVIGAEIGVDVGAHAEALLRYKPIELLFLIDPWPKDFYLGWCKGRLSALGMETRCEFKHMTSMRAIGDMPDGSLDFLYIDQFQDAAAGDLIMWWSKMRQGAVVGVRNYSDSWPQMVREIDEWTARNNIRFVKETGEIVLWKD